MIGIGVECLDEAPAGKIAQILDRAFAAGVTHVDPIWALPYIEQRRDAATIASSPFTWAPAWSTGSPGGTGGEEVGAIWVIATNS